MEPKSIVTNEDCMALMARYPDKYFDLAIVDSFNFSNPYVLCILGKSKNLIMTLINDLQIGKAGEYLVCADLILNGHIAFPSEQGLPFDVIFQFKHRLFKVQVKTTRGSKEIPQRKTSIPAYIFHIGNNGKMNRRKKYDAEQVDVFALVALDTKRIGYLPYFNTQTTMNFRVPEYRGQYHDEQGTQQKALVMQLKAQGLTPPEIAKETGLKLSNVYKYNANVSIEQKGTNAGKYFDELTLEKCLHELQQHKLV